MKNINIDYSNIINRAARLLSAAVIFGGLGAYIGIQTVFAIDARQDDRINSILKANQAVAQAPAIAPKR